jgi:outer membrane protein assembly factor BamA
MTGDMQKAFIYFLLGWLPAVVCGQLSKNADTDSTGRNIKFAGFPVLGYSPETRIIGGVYAQLMMGDPSHMQPSVMGLSLLVSQNRQFSFNLFPDIWSRDDTYRLAGEIKWQYWPDKFYGIGNHTRKEAEEYYVSKLWGIKLDLLRMTWRNVYAGLLLEAESNHIIEYDTVSHASLPEGSIPGSKKAAISGAGLSIVWDSRSDILLPASGAYCQFRLVIFNRAMGSTYPYSKWIVDLRKYWNLGHDHLLFVQAYGKFLWAKEVPFRNLALIGGDKLLRGYYRGRYRDHNMFLGQVEYHSPYVWRFSLVAFAGAGDVFHAVNTMQEIRIKPAGGVGLRYRLFRDRRMNLRLDLAAGKDGHGVYLGILEAF